jgi:serine protease Do
MSSPNTLYAALGITPEATADVIEAAFHEREQALQGNSDAISLVRVAYDTLRHPERRAAYDRKLEQQLARSESIVGEYQVLPQQRNSHARNWLILIIAVACTAGLFWFNKKPALKLATPVVASRPAAEASAGETPPSPPTPAEAATPNEAPAAIASRETTVSAAPTLATTQVMQSRGAKPPGFDARYVSWSVFAIRQRNRSGSGVMIGPDRILTNCHVLAGGATNGLVVINGVTEKISKVEKYARLDDEDACLLLAPGSGSDSIAWGSSAALRQGDTVHTFGHPGGSSDIIWSEGSFRASVERSGETFLITSNYCRPGSSGGPLLDNEGRLVGIVTAVQRFQARGGDPQYGVCISVTEASARALLSKPLFPIALAPAQYISNY